MLRDHARAGITLNVIRDRVSELVVEWHERSQSRIFELFSEQRLARLVLNIQFLRPVIIVARAHDSTFLWKQSVNLGQLVRC